MAARDIVDPDRRRSLNNVGRIRKPLWRLTWRSRTAPKEEH
jgi:hypothetical protein